MTNTIEGKDVVAVAWYCERDGNIQLTTGFVASNRAYVEQHKDCDWRPLLHPDVVAELIERERTQRMQYAGVIGFLCSISTHITDEDEQDAIDRIVADWCALSGWSWRRLLDRVEVEPPNDAALARATGATA
jgi:hypothetical protein